MKDLTMVILVVWLVGGCITLFVASVDDSEIDVDTACGRVVIWPALLIRSLIRGAKRAWRDK